VVTSHAPSAVMAAPPPLPEFDSVNREAITRLRLATAVSLIAELILPIYELGFSGHADWLAILIQTIWFVFTVLLLGVTWHPRFTRMWKPSVLLFATALVLSSGVLSLKGASLGPFLFLVVLLPVGGACLPWEAEWQAAMSAICVLFGFAFGVLLGWHGGLIISGLSAMVASILGSLLINEALTRQRSRIESYVRALSRSESKFRKIFETSPSILMIFSVPEGLMVDCNPACEKTFGFSCSGAAGKTAVQLGLVSDSAGARRWLDSLKLGDRGSLRDAVIFWGPENQPIHTVYSWSTFELDDHLCVLVAGQDATARMRAEEELRRNREAMANQERLTAVGELASGIAHDLNNSLNALSLNVELLRTEHNVPAQYRERLELLSRIVSDANATIGRLQDFARRRHDRPVTPVNLREIIRESLEMVHSTLEQRSSVAGASISVESNLPELPLILGEPAELRQIFLNLLLNARDAMPAGGAIHIGGNFSPHEVVITVEDEGNGIPAENLDRVFDPFFTTKGEGGTGLGLSVAYGAMARLGGSISAGNRPSGGAIFTLRFPLAPAADVGRTPERSPARVEPRRVMVIDDDTENLNALSALFKSRGHSVVTNTSGDGALKELMREDCPIDVVFCDLGMPGVNGWEVARQVKSKPAPPAFYLFTGWAQEIPADDPRRRWVDAVVPKPVEAWLLDRLLAEAEVSGASPEP
jgi:signal transduction histidine kinase/ActR/RegA family two-component response regulator